MYADGIAISDAELGGFRLDAGTDWSHLYGYPSPYEVWNASGIGVAGAHWIPVRNDPTAATSVSTMPFGRPKNQGYWEGLHKTTEISSPSKLIWFGDGGSGTALWSDDNWWIKDVVDGAEDEWGFNRLLQDDYGCRRHGGKAPGRTSAGMLTTSDLTLAQNSSSLALAANPVPEHSRLSLSLRFFPLGREANPRPLILRPTFSWTAQGKRIRRQKSSSPLTRNHFNSTRPGIASLSTCPMRMKSHCCPSEPAPYP